MLYPDDDTIAAIASPVGEGGIAIVRMSGPRALDAARAAFRYPHGQCAFESHRVYHGFAGEPGSAELADEVIMIVMRAPRSYTRQDVVEFQCHGGLIPARRVLGILLGINGVRMAGPGEFTKRAFLNGRIDLSQAEATMDIIRARTEEAERAAFDQLSGRLSGRVGQLREGLLRVLSNVEAHIDFPEDEIEPAALEEMIEGMAGTSAGIARLMATFSRGRLLREGLRAAIVGRPNVGKSSLLNALLESDRAIVADMPGTTRDVIEDAVNINGLPMIVMDTAGIRESHEMAEAEGVRRSLKAIAEADMVIAVFDASCELAAEDREVLERIKGRPAVIVLNKADLGVRVDMQGLRVSARTDEGMAELKSAIYDLAAGASGKRESVTVTNRRHYDALERAQGRLDAAMEAMRAEPLEIAAFELREAADALGSIVGVISADDVLNRIFSDFCIGK